jgi:hypothetical protein
LQYHDGPNTKEESFFAPQSQRNKIVNSKKKVFDEQ